MRQTGGTTARAWVAEVIGRVEDRKRAFIRTLGDVGTRCQNYCFGSGLITHAIRDAMVCAPPFTSEVEVDELVAKAKGAIDRTAKDYGKM